MINGPEYQHALKQDKFEFHRKALSTKRRKDV